MALTRELGGLSIRLLRNKGWLYGAVRCYSDKPAPWNYLWRPETYSKENHDKIAEKYHLHPKDYEPYPNNEAYIGDYPKLPMIGPAAKDLYYPYDIPTMKRNYHEPMHDLSEIMAEDRYSYGVKYRIHPVTGILIFLATIVVTATITYVLQPYPSFIPRMEQQFPKAGVVHYSFEPLESDTSK